MQSDVTCENFAPQRFRPNFCKTCCKTKAEHIPLLAKSSVAPLPAPIATLPGNRHSVSTSVGFQTGKQLVRPPAAKKDEAGQKRNTFSSSGRRSRNSIIINTNRISKVVKTGFIAKQQNKGEIPNADKFFQESLRGLLSQGIGLNQNETEDILRRIKAITIKREQETPLILLEKRKMNYLTEHLKTASEFVEEQTELKNIITVQSLARRFLITKRFKAMSATDLEMLKKRNAVYIDLVRTERKFVDSIDDLIRNYIVRIRQSDVVAPHECAFIFSNIETVAEEHRRLLHHLEDAADNWPFIKNIGAIFLDIKPLLNALSVYVSNFKNAMNEIERISDENPKFASFIAQQAGYESDLTMSLSMPVNRIAQYEYVLRNLADCIPQGSKEREDCENAFAVLAQSSLVVQTSLVQSGETAMILSLQRTLKADRPMSLIKPDRRLLEEFRFKKYLVCLFNDLVVLARIPQQKGFSTGRTKKQEELNKVKSITDLNDCSIRVDKKDHIELTMGKDVTKLHPQSVGDAKKFVISFNTAVEELNRAKVFGVALKTTVEREDTDDGIPLVLKKCVPFVENGFLEQPGIFRLAGSKTEIGKLRDIFDRGGEDAENIKLKDVNVHSVCDIIKSYLRSFPEPLLSYNVYDPLVQLMKDQSNDVEARIAKIKSELKTHTPPEAIKVLKYMIDFLTKVCAHGETNKMISSNVAIVFGPTFLWPLENSLESAMDMPYVNGVIQIILDNPKEVLDDL